MRPLAKNCSASEAKDNRTKDIHRQKNQAGLADGQADPAREDQTKPCRSMAVLLQFWVSLTESLHLMYQGTLRARRARPDDRRFACSTPALREA